MTFAKDSRQIKVLYLVVNLHRGGVQQTVLDLCRHLDRRYLPMACAIEENGDIGREIADLGFEVATLGLNIKPHRLRIVWELNRLMRRHRIDLLHPASYHPSFLGRVAGISARVPILLNHEHLLVTRRRPHRAFIHQVLDRFTQAHITVSAALRRQAIDWHGINPGKIEVIYNSVPSHFFQAGLRREAARQQLGLSPNHKVIGMVARLNLVKGYQYLFPALAELKDHYPIKVLLAGSGPHEPEIRHLVKTHDLESQVEFLGMRSDVPDLLAAMDIFVLPSDHEGFSVALLEAMAAGLPIVASDHEGNVEAVEPRKSALIFPRGQVDALRNCLVELLEDPALNRRLGQAAQEQAAAHFTVSRYVQQVQDLYDRLVKQVGGLK